MVFYEPGFLLIRRSLVRAQVEEPLHKALASNCKGFFLGLTLLLPKKSLFFNSSLIVDTGLSKCLCRT